LPHLLFILKWIGYRAQPLITLLPNCSIRCPDFCFICTVLSCGVSCSTPHMDGGGGATASRAAEHAVVPLLLAATQLQDDRRRPCHPSTQPAADLVLRDMTDGGAVPSRCNRRRPRSPVKATPGSDRPSLSSLSSSPACGAVLVGLCASSSSTQNRNLFTM